MTSENTTKSSDCLYTIFEQHLFNIQDPNTDREQFVEGIVREYLSHMRRLGLSIPMEWEAHILEELGFQVHSMLVKKIYGCQTIDEYTAKAPTEAKKRARARYAKLQKETHRAARAPKKAVA
jgi:hypothetical protein